MDMQHKIEEVFKLVAETGGHLIVVFEKYDPFVIMDIAQYRTLLKTAAAKEKLVDLTETELLEKINQDIAEWREARQNEIAEYDLSQFRVDSSASYHAGVPGKPKAARKMGPGKLESGVPNLPVVDDSGNNEYKLEPLS